LQQCRFLGQSLANAISTAGNKQVTYLGSSQNFWIFPVLECTNTN
jgi:hypothetical protein